MIKAEKFELLLVDARQWRATGRDQSKINPNAGRMPNCSKLGLETLTVMPLAVRGATQGRSAAADLRANTAKG